MDGKMEGILTVQDTRQNLDNMKKWRNEAVKNSSTTNNEW